MSHDLLFTNESDWFAQDLRAIYDSFIEGVKDLAGGDLEVTAGGTGLSVDVAAGVGYVQGDAVADQGLYRVLVESPINSDAFLVGFDAADGTDPRIDQILARVYDDEADLSGLTAFQLEVLTGTPTTGANLTNHDGAAALPDSAMRLAYVLVDAGATSLTAPKIEDTRTSAGGGGGGGASWGPWTDLPILGDWADGSGGDFFTPQFRQDSDNDEVELRGAVTGGTPGTAFVQTWQPDADQVFTCWSDVGPIPVIVQASGNVIDGSAAPTATTIWLDPIAYSQLVSA